MKVLILSTIRAPYRTELFDLIGKEINELTVFFEQSTEKTRNQSWLSSKTSNYEEIISKYSLKSKRFVRWDFIKRIDTKTDAVIFYEYSTITAMIGILKCINRKIPYFINVDGAFINRDSFFKFKMKKNMITKAHGYLANGVSAAHYLQYYGADYNDINLHHFSSISKKDIDSIETIIDIKKQREKNTYITVGRFISLKKIDFLIKMWRKVPEDKELLIIGEGTELERYKELIDKYQLTNIKILDFQEKDSLFYYYKQATALLFPSENEVWGLVVQEALINGLPVIGTIKSNAVFELIENGKNGYICNLDENEWIECMNSIESRLDFFSYNSYISALNYTIENEAFEILTYIKKCI